MAQEVSVTLIDDLNGGPAAETVKFALDGRKYQIDLSTANARRLRTAFKPWITKSRRDSAPVGRPRRAAAQASGDSPQAIRAWAASKRIKVPARGRIPAAVAEKYRAAGGK